MPAASGEPEERPPARAFADRPMGGAVSDRSVSGAVSARGPTPLPVRASAAHLLCGPPPLAADVFGGCAACYLLSCERRAVMNQLKTGARAGGTGQPLMVDRSCQ